MNPFQTMLLVVVGALCVGTGMAVARKWISYRAALLAIFLWIAAGVATVWPDLTTRVAQRVGITRGADLVLYCTVVVTMVGFLMTYTRVCRLRREITLLVRALALQETDGAGPEGIQE